MHVKIYPETVFAAIFDGSEEVAPGDLGHIGVIRVRGDGPVRERDADVIETRVLDLLEGLLGHEKGVVFL